MKKKSNKKMFKSTEDYLKDGDTSFVGLSLNRSNYYYNEEGNPVFLIEAFLTSYKAGLYPPMWVLDQMYESLNKTHESFGEITVDEALNLSGGKSGNRLKYTNYLTRRRNLFFFENLYKLDKYFGEKLNTIYACEMVIALFKKDNPSLSKAVYVPPADSIKTLYMKFCRDEDYEIEFINTRKPKFGYVSYLKRFPLDSMPEHLMNLAEEMDGDSVDDDI